MSKTNKHSQGQEPRQSRWIIEVPTLLGLFLLFKENHDPTKAPNKAVVLLGKVVVWFLVVCLLILCTTLSELPAQILFGLCAILLAPLKVTACIWTCTRLPHWLRYVIVAVCFAIVIVIVGAAGTV